MKWEDLPVGIPVLVDLKFGAGDGYELIRLDSHKYVWKNVGYEEYELWDSAQFSVHWSHGQIIDTFGSYLDVSPNPLFCTCPISALMSGGCKCGGR
jgi:hypothetical protein